MAVVVVLLAAACADDDDGGGSAADDGEAETSTTAAPADADVPGEISLRSPAFAEGETIPTEFTCDGEDAVPPLEWGEIPGTATALAITVIDPDAPGDSFLHWAVLNLRPSETSVDQSEPPGATVLPNDFGVRAWRGPCPPEGDAPHTYEFTLWALASDAPLPEGEDVDLDRLIESLQERTVGQGMLSGVYGRG